MPQSTDLLQGTLDLLILQTLLAEEMHGRAVAQHVRYADLQRRLRRFQD